MTKKDEQLEKGYESQHLDLDELFEDELSKVSGGGSGYAKYGIYGVEFSLPETGRYYSYRSEVKTNDKVFYCDEVNGNLVGGRIEYFYVDNNNNWSTKFFYKNVYRSIDEFKNSFPYVLNIRP